MAGSDPSESVDCYQHTNPGQQQPYSSDQAKPKLREYQAIDIDNNTIYDDPNESTHLGQCATTSSNCSSHWSITRTIRQLAVGALCLVVSVLLNLTVLAVIHDRVPRFSQPLPDVTFDLLPKYNRALDISEYIIMFMTTSALLMTFLHRYRSIVFRRLCLVLCMLYLLRAICMGVTQLPVANPQYYCSPQLNLTTELGWWSYAKTIISRVSHMSLGMGLSVNGRHSFCGDYIFSGHTVMLVTTYLFLNEYWLRTRPSAVWRIVRWTYVALVCTGIVCIVLSRGHYMVDIVLAYYISTRVFLIYHCACDNALASDSFGQQRYRRMLWYTVFTYVESDTIQHRIRVQNDFEISELNCFRSIKR